MSLQSQSHDRPPSDGDPAEAVSALVPAWLCATLPLALDEHLPTASVIADAAFRHPASYMTQLGGGKVEDCCQLSNVSLGLCRETSPQDGTVRTQSPASRIVQTHFAPLALPIPLADRGR